MTHPGRAHRGGRGSLPARRPRRSGNRAALALCGHPRWPCQRFGGRWRVPGLAELAPPAPAEEGAWRPAGQPPFPGPAGGNPNRRAAFPSRRAFADHYYRQRQGARAGGGFLLQAPARGPAIVAPHRPKRQTHAKARLARPQRRRGAAHQVLAANPASGFAARCPLGFPPAHAQGRQAPVQGPQRQSGKRRLRSPC